MSSIIKEPRYDVVVTNHNGMITHNTVTSAPEGYELFERLVYQEPNRFIVFKVSGHSWFKQLFRFKHTWVDKILMIHYPWSSR